ncbi:MAG: DNA-binding transcriptional ArsR family regulator [Planctomycetota bacterium]|jgi:DNA-binding transcriptional ArsR family regulator
MSMEQVATRLAALGNTTRLGIYRILVRAGHTGLPVAGVQTKLDIPASTLSHHLHKLLEVGLVSQEREGTTLICHADFSVMEATFALFEKECCVDEQGAQPCKPDETPCC